METPYMTDEKLAQLHEQAYHRFNMKVDIYHSEKHRGIIMVPHGAPLHPGYVLHAVKY